jgi:hypothetical protein
MFKEDAERRLTHGIQELQLYLIPYRPLYR